MARQDNTPTDPKLQRAIVRAAAVEFIFFAAGLAAYFTTHSMTWLIVLGGMGMVAFLAIFFPAFLRSRDDAAQTSQSPVVQDGEF
jgi:hypothetical protein